MEKFKTYVGQIRFEIFYEEDLLGRIDTERKKFFEDLFSSFLFEEGGGISRGKVYGIVPTLVLILRVNQEIWEKFKEFLKKGGEFSVPVIVKSSALLFGRHFDAFDGGRFNFIVNDVWGCSFFSLEKEEEEKTPCPARIAEKRG